MSGQGKAPTLDTLRVVTRLETIDWDGDYTRSGSRIQLMQEYLRRAALWAQALDCPNRWPFFDIAAYVDPSAHVDEGYFSQLRSRLGGAGAIHPTLNLIRYMLNFTVLEFRPPGLPDPFEPLLRVLERGGNVNRTHGIELGLVAMHPRWETYAGRAEPFRIDEPHLDMLDADWEARRAEDARWVAESRAMRTEDDAR
ncbi:hypothetical protein [Catellatospora bangladeshensis]|uniref:Uncharacterized protein n=1 Tax=Catellatospora bangladeshensis TaxID=310355 RepID=A0A8J3JE95_9ACTN|nr:hypothetical protein [Catellatospora bangladeshensis]GIF79058.1 hypothetical protein Cba03nite_04070 [Catellatospora bangladeshensis]